jgi:hypothetical protein
MLPAATAQHRRSVGAASSTANHRPRDGGSPSDALSPASSFRLVHSSNGAAAEGSSVRREHGSAKSPLRSGRASPTRRSSSGHLAAAGNSRRRSAPVDRRQRVVVLQLPAPRALLATADENADGPAARRQSGPQRPASLGGTDGVSAGVDTAGRRAAPHVVQPVELACKTASTLVNRYSPAWVDCQVHVPVDSGIQVTSTTDDNGATFFVPFAAVRRCVLQPAAHMCVVGVERRDGGSTVYLDLRCAADLEAVVDRVQRGIVRARGDSPDALPRMAATVACGGPPRPMPVTMNDGATRRDIARFQQQLASDMAPR